MLSARIAGSFTSAFKEAALRQEDMKRKAAKRNRLFLGMLIFVLGEKPVYHS